MGSRANVTRGIVLLRARIPRGVVVCFKRVSDDGIEKKTDIAVFFHFFFFLHHHSLKHVLLRPRGKKDIASTLLRIYRYFVPAAPARRLE